MAPPARHDTALATTQHSLSAIHPRHRTGEGATQKEAAACASARSIMGDTTPGLAHEDARARRTYGGSRRTNGDGAKQTHGDARGPTLTALEREAHAWGRAGGTRTAPGARGKEESGVQSNAPRRLRSPSSVSQYSSYVCVCDRRKRRREHAHTPWGRAKRRPGPHIEKEDRDLTERRKISYFSSTSWSRERER